MLDRFGARDATDLAALVAQEKVSPTELLDAALAASAEVNPQINAVVLTQVFKAFFAAILLAMPAPLLAQQQPSWKKALALTRRLFMHCLCDWRTMTPGNHFT